MHDPNATKGFQDIHITSKFIETNYDIFLDFCYESFNVIFAWRVFSKKHFLLI